MSATLSTVPIPGFWRIGNHSSRTTTPTRLVTQPNAIPVWMEMPWESTSHGAIPIAACTIMAIAMP